MLVIRVQLLNGRYRATQFDDHARAEWPPHPARLFYAATDTVFDTDTPDPGEIAMLYAWEALGAPSVTCSDRINDSAESAWLRRAPTEHFVVGNSARSHRRDLQSHWQKLESLRIAVSDASDARTLERASKALEKATRTFADAVTAATRAGGAESASVIDGVLEVLPENRGKQPRTFPIVTPDTPEFSFQWDADLLGEHLATLDAVLSRITRLGHSSSQVSCSVSTKPVTPTWIPMQRGTRGTHDLRTVEPGVLDALRYAYGQHRGSGERTMHSELTPYRGPDRKVPDEASRQRGIGDWIVLPFETDKLPLSRTQDVTRAVRAALIRYAEEPVPSVVSGHGPGDEPVPHIGVLVLPNVTSPYSDGTIQSIAISLPSAISADDKDSVLNALAHWMDTETRSYNLRLVGGAARTLGEAVFHADSAASDESRGAISSRRFWARTSDSWSTVTPIALDRHPKIKASADFDTVTQAVAPIVADMCTSAGLPRPVNVTASPAPIWPTAPVVGRATPSRAAFPVYRVGGGDGARKFTTHVSMTFAEEVRGPIILGAGRFFGYGLCYPTPKGIAP